MHLLIGAPGTAKTTVAKLMGNMMAEAHLLPGNRFICVNGADLKGLYVGHTAPKVRQLFMDNDIIMIDEAYSLTAQGSEILAYFKERVKDRNFGNGREARSLLENAMVFAAVRVNKIPTGKIKKRQLQEITVSDIRKALERMRKSNQMQMGRSEKREMGFA